MTPGSEAPKVKVAVSTAIVPDGPVPIVIVGEVVSTVQPCVAFGPVAPSAIA